LSQFLGRQRSDIFVKIQKEFKDIGYSILLALFYFSLPNRKIFALLSFGVTLVTKSPFSKVYFCTMKMNPSGWAKFIADRLTCLAIVGLITIAVKSLTH